MTAPDSTRKAIRRSILKQEGKTRVEVVLDARELEIVDGMIQTLGPGYGYKDRASAIRMALQHGLTQSPS